MIIGPSASFGFFVFANSFLSAGIIVFSPSANVLMPILLYITKPFYNRKLIIYADNTTTIKTTNSTI